MGANEKRPVYIVTGYEEEQIPAHLTPEEALEYQFKDAAPAFETLPVPVVEPEPVYEEIEGWSAIVDTGTGEVMTIERDAAVTKPVTDA